MNGGALGNDAKVTFKRNKTADVTGIDNQELNALPMVDATANAIADKGPVVLACSSELCTPRSQSDTALSWTNRMVSGMRHIYESRWKTSHQDS